MEIDALREREAIVKILSWARAADGTCRYVVTPNVDHALLFRGRADLRAAYRDAALVLADGTPLIWASRWFKKPLPERVTGADLTPALFRAADDQAPLRVFLLGAGPGVAERARERIHAGYPGVRVVGTASPAPGFEHDESENARLVDAVNASAAHVLVLGLGAPKQELWIHRQRGALSVPVALCVGAAIDFLADAKPRAPLLLQQNGLEWLYRALSEPRRLGPRYVKNIAAFPELVAREWLAQR
jgi:N-acetylglucosaminyldiphosphoundecaprenol N-acetyl-beta-D-mannosaminyltransferase